MTLGADLDPSPTTLPGDVPRVAEHPRRRELTDAVCQDLATTTDPVREGMLRERLVELNMPVAEAIASRYYRRGVAAEDLCQVAYLALVKAARRFDPGHRGIAFLPYAVPTVRGEVRRYFRDLGWMVRPPRGFQERQLAALRARSSLELRLGREPSSEEIAEELGEDPADVREALASQGCFSPDSLDMTVDDRASTTVADLLGSEDPAHAAAEARATLAPVVRALPSRDRRVLEMRFVDDLSQREIAEHLDLSQVQVSRLLSRILPTCAGPSGDAVAQAGGCRTVTPCPAAWSATSRRAISRSLTLAWEEVRARKLKAPCSSRS